MTEPTSQAESQTTQSTGPLAVPIELQDKGLGAPADETDAAAPDALAPVDVDRPTGLSAFVDSTHSYVREYIALADQKAAFAFTVSATMLVYIYREGALEVWLTSPRAWGLAAWITFGASLGLCIGTSASIMAVWPRLRGASRGVVFWKAIAGHDSAQAYVTHLESMSNQGLVSAKAAHLYEIAAVCTRKYRWVSVAIWATAAGMVLALAAVLSGSV